MPSANEAHSIESELENESANSNLVCAAQAAADLAHATPAMRQYFEVKSRHADCLVFYRMGDFYELFFEDAAKASAILDIALTKRGKHAGQEIPMCGVPVHAADMYLQKLIASGERIAICEQMETPEQAKKRGPKEVVRREVVRIVTPGTITEEALLAPQQSHYLAALYIDKASTAALAWLELSTGEFTVSSLPLAQLPALLARVAPRELLLSQAGYDALGDQPWFHEWRGAVHIRHKLPFDARRGERLLTSHYAVASSEVLGQFTPPQLAAAGALLEYVQLTQLEAVARLDIPRCDAPDACLQMDAATRRNLELVATQSGQRAGSLLATLDATVSAAGSRLLAHWLNAPLCALAEIEARHEAVAWFVGQPNLLEQWRGFLAKVPDMERAMGRLALGRGGPRDLSALGGGLAQANALHEAARNKDLPPLLATAMRALQGHHQLAEYLAEALQETVPMLARDGNFIRPGFRADLDEWRRLRDESTRVLAVLEQRLKKETDIASLKVKHNNVLGYFIEITQIHEKKVPATFIHRQSLAGSLRYATPELNDTARQINEAADRALKLEQAIYEEILAKVLAQAESVIAAARALAALDVLMALATRALEGQWVRPNMVVEPVLEITAGRHPVVETALRRAHKEFIANDSHIGGQGRLWLVTGPNMGGKSTFLRQQAMLVILAQMGSFVPAQAARIGMCDKLFCRVGAGDDLARGQSTFMVEMVETASILHQATAQSLVVLDEIGRGTATYDGVSLAWAVAEHLHNVTQCRALFATHYHELTALAAQLPYLKNYHAAVKEHRDKLIFLHAIREGYADKSYGIHVAALAGMPKPVLIRAKQLLATLESGHSLTEELTAQALPLFASAPAAAMPVGCPESKPNPALERLASLDPDSITPRQALDLLAELKALAEE